MRLEIDEALRRKIKEWQHSPHRKEDPGKPESIARANDLAESISPIPTDLESVATIESLLCHDFVGYYVITTQSLYQGLQQLGQDLPRVIIWDDGTLDRKDTDFLNEKIPGIRIISREVYDQTVNDLSKDYPNVAKFAQTKFPRGRNYGLKLVVPFVNVADSERILLTDSDILFYKPPPEIADWLSGTLPEDSIYNVEWFDPVEKVYQKGDFPWRVEDETFVGLYDERELARLSKLMDREVEFAPELNAGLLGTQPRRLELRFLDKLIGALFERGYSAESPRFDLMEQAIQSFVVAMTGTYHGLSKDGYVCTSRVRPYQEEHIARHFLGASKFRDDYWEAVERVIE